MHLNLSYNLQSLYHTSKSCHRQGVTCTYTHYTLIHTGPFTGSWQQVRLDSLGQAGGEIQLKPTVDANHDTFDFKTIFIYSVYSFK